MDKNIYIWIVQDYADIKRIEAFDDKQKLLDFVYEYRKSEVLQQLRLPKHKRNYRYIKYSDEELKKFIESYKQSYKNGTFNDGCIIETELNPIFNFRRK